MANTGAAAMDETMRYAEYSPKTNVRNDAEIDRRLVSVRVVVGELFSVCQMNIVRFNDKV